MRIGIDARLWNETGVGRYIRNLVTQLLQIDKKNTYILFVLSRDKKVLSSELSALSSNKVGLVEANVRWHTLEEQNKMPVLLSLHRLDLVHFPYFSIPIFYRKDFVVTIHDLILHHFPTGKSSTLPLPLYKLKLIGYRFIIDQAVRRAKKIITVSNATKQELLEHFPINEDKVIVTYEGIDKELSVSSPRSNSELSALSSPYFLYVGNAYPHKNLDRLIDAFILTQKNFEEVKLVLLGKEDFFHLRLKERVKSLHLQKSIMFYDNVSDEELASFYQNAQALVLPSFMEGFGLPALEAMANSCLVIASDIPSLKEIGKDAPLYFDPKDIDELAIIMQEILEKGKSSFTNNIEKGLERAKGFSWKTMAEQTLEVYESCYRLRSSK